MKKTVLIYGSVLALLVFTLQYFEYRVLVHDLSAEFYITVIAVMFTGLGIWVGRKLTTRKAPVAAFQKNTKALDYLGISERELEVLELVAEGLSNQQVADKLFVSINTVKTHLSRVYEKLEVKRRTQAVEKAKSLKLIP
jgi:DNA-binding CsgD family transcriptional regulator